jgi:EmrB/QacA subfamily drug resistance transporter
MTTTERPAGASVAPGSQRHGKWWPLAAVCIAIFMLLIDITVVNVALPSIQSQLHASFSELQWVVDAYALTLAVFQLTSGSLGDRVGRKPVFVTGIVLFVVSSLACGLAPDARVLDAFRAVQGVGGAVMFANSLAIIGENYTGRDRGTAFGVWGATTGASIALGPLIGGAVTSGIDWRWIFFINLPIGAAAILLSVFRLGRGKAEERRRIDWVGLMLSGGGLTALVYALIEGNNAGWGSTEILVLFAVAAVLFFAFAVSQTRVSQPMFDVRLFRRPGFTGAQVAAFGLSASLFAMFLYLTLYLQDVLGLSAFGAGLRLLPITLLTFLAAPIAGTLSARVPFRLLIPAGLLLAGVGLLLMHGLTVSSTWTALLVGFALAGVGSGLINPPLGSLAVGVVEQQRSGMGAGVNNSFRQVGLATGIGAYGALFQTRVARVLNEHLGRFAHGQITPLAKAVSSGALRTAEHRAPPQFRAAVGHVTRLAFISGLNELLVIAGVVALCSAVLCAVLIRQRDLVSGQRD